MSLTTDFSQGAAPAAAAAAADFMFIQAQYAVPSEIVRARGAACCGAATRKKVLVSLDFSRLGDHKKVGAKKP